MNAIPLRQLNTEKNSIDFSQFFKIRKIEGEAIVELPHRHNYYFLLALQNGQGLHEIDFEQYPVVGNEVFVMRPGQVHRLQLEEGAKAYLINIVVSPYFNRVSFNLDLLKKVARQNCYKLNTLQFEKGIPYLDAAFQEFMQKDPGYEEVVKANLSIFITQLFRLGNTDRTPMSYAQERFDEFQELLETHIYSMKNVSSYASLMNLSSYQLNTITKSLVGKTCSEMIQQQVILEAKRLLMSTTYQVREIAYELGYDDIPYFNRLFKKHTASSPSNFRNNYK